MSSTNPKTTRVGVISLGCAKNLVDTEVMLGHLEKAGCAFVDDANDADVVIVNTCSFIGPAREESVQTILEAAELKKSGHAKRLIVAGCMVQRYAAEMKESLPEVDAFIGLDELHRVVAAAQGLEGLGAWGLDPLPGPPPLPELATGEGRQPSPQAPKPSSPQSAERRRPGPQAPKPASPLASKYLYDHTAPRRRATAPWTAYVKIAEGCDHTCSFCPIPVFRGKFRSRDPLSVVAEARALAAEGVVEINLIAQDSSHFGRDRGDYDGLANLLRALNDVDDLRWIRLHYLYPNTVTDRLIAAMAELPKVVPYVDMPLQHAHPDMLQRMRRGGSGERHLQLLERFRRAMPGAALRSTFIVGFPGETEEEFATLKEFLMAAAFDHLGVFTYSHEESTSAGELADDVPEEVKEARRDEIMELQQSLVERRLQEKIGAIEEVLVEGVHPETDLLLVGRMATQAQDVDGQVLINDGVADVGRFVRVEITDVAGYDLVGRVLD